MTPFGGFSMPVFQSVHMSQYLGSNKNPGGYIGHDERSQERDRIVESELSRVGLGPEGMACWLASGEARHFMDGFSASTSDVEFRSAVAKIAPMAYVLVTVWAHPDFRGTLGSRKAIINLLRKALKETEDGK